MERHNTKFYGSSNNHYHYLNDFPPHHYIWDILRLLNCALKVVSFNDLNKSTIYIRRGHLSETMLRYNLQRLEKGKLIQSIKYKIREGVKKYYKITIKGKDILEGYNEKYKYRRKTLSEF